MHRILGRISVLVFLIAVVAAGVARFSMAEPPATTSEAKPATETTAVKAVEPAAAIDKPAPDFTLTGADGKAYKLSDFQGKYVVLEWNNLDCPFVKKHYGSGNMQALQKKYTDAGAVWLTICSSAPGKQGYYEPAALQEKAKEGKFAATAYLRDPDGKVGREYGAKTTPHMYVIDPKGVLVYAGAIDDKPSADPNDVKTASNYVAACLDESMAGKVVATKSTTSYGCSVKYAN